MPHHFIRLRRPWRRVLSSSTNVTRVDVPDQLIPISLFYQNPDLDHPNVLQHQVVISPTAAYQRSFHRPTGLTPQDRVQLHISHWDGYLESISINGHPLSVPKDDKAHGPSCWEIQEHLQSSNLLEIILRSEDSEAIGLTGEVCLEV